VSLYRKMRCAPNMTFVAVCAGSTTTDTALERTLCSSNVTWPRCFAIRSRLIEHCDCWSILHRQARRQGVEAEQGAPADRGHERVREKRSGHLAAAAERHGVRLATDPNGDIANKNSRSLRSVALHVVQL
jgi:hypothetical protein